MESVCSQSSREFEYIIIDGGSTDGSVEVIRSFSSIPLGVYSDIEIPKIPHAPCTMPIVYWISEPDRGIYNAMNKGIQVTRGEYCQFLNSGDRLASKNVVEKMLGTLPDCGIYYGNMLKQMPKGKIFRDTCEEGKLTMLSFYRGSLNHSPAFIRRCLFEKYGLYDETLRIVSDWKWYLNVIGIHNVSLQYINFDVTCYDMNGISNTDKELENQERRNVLEELLPANILADYDSHWRNIEQASRINRYKITKVVYWIVDRIIYKWEKAKKNKQYDSREY